MLSFQTEKRVFVSAKKVYEVVCNIEAYPNFLPGLKAAHIYNQKKNELYADFLIEYGPWKSAYTSHVVIEDDPQSKTKIIRSQAVKGQVDHLDSCWRIHDMGGEMCHITYQLELTVKSTALSLILKPIFASFGKTVIEAFEKQFAQK